MKFLSQRLALLIVSFAFSLSAQTPLFEGGNLDAWEFEAGGLVVEDDGSMACRMKEVKLRSGEVKLRGMGYIWTQEEFEDFDLTLSYKLSDGCNSGVFFRSDPKNPVQGGFEIQLLDNEGFQKAKGRQDDRKKNGSLYDAKAPSVDPANGVGKWNTFRLKCKGPQVEVWINGKSVVTANLEDWKTAKQNPDGTPNKFKTALSELPALGRIGFQNHGQMVWFKDVSIIKL